jgi:hypothetical protein
LALYFTSEHQSLTIEPVLSIWGSSHLSYRDSSAWRSICLSLTSGQSHLSVSITVDVVTTGHQLVLYMFALSSLSLSYILADVCLSDTTTAICAPLQAARSVAERALKRILFREEGERLNVWVALLNLELKHGSRDALAAAFERACAAAHPKRVHLKLAEARVSAQLGWLWR